MPGTTLQDVIVPELFNPYVTNRTMELSALVQSGIIVNNTEFDALASQASPLVNMPFFEDLTGQMKKISRHWQDIDVDFDALYSGLVMRLRRC